MSGLDLFAPAPPGRRDGALLILGPALGAGASMRDGVADLLVDEYRTQTFEHFGFNGAPVMREAFSVPDLADAVVHLVDAADVEQAFFAGDSISGAVALELGRRHPDGFAAVASVCSIARRRADLSMAPLAEAVRRKRNTVPGGRHISPLVRSRCETVPW